jgi:hypothetical protein
MTILIVQKNCVRTLAFHLIAKTILLNYGNKYFGISNRTILVSSHIYLDYQKLLCYNNIII